VLHPDDKAILADFYYSLISKGFGWNLANDLCTQTGVTCDSSDPQRITQLYCFWLIYILEVDLLI